MKKVPVYFLRGMSPYQAGEVAGFSPAISKRLVEEGYAKYYQTEDKLTKEKYEEMKKSGKSDKEIYEAFGLSQSAFYKLKKGWKK